MKLISCDIENFGKISNSHFDFTRVCNIICENNGWGKSTLATFIRVMFFGFENSNSRDDINNERKRFTPWQGGVYGGKIHFESNGCEYILSRTFGVKEKDDKFSLRNAQTNLETSDFTSNLGIELFNIDGKSFTRTVYITQNDCDTEFTDSINAKLGNLAEHTDDINNFEKVDRALKNLINKMSPSKLKGSLSVMRSEIIQKEQYIRQMQAVEKRMQEISDLQNKDRERYQNLKQQQEQLQTDKIKLSKVKDNQLLYEKYNNLLSDCELKKNKLIQSEEFFHGDIPSKECLSDYSCTINSLIQHENEIARCQMSDSELEALKRYKKLFSNNIPTDVRISELISSWNLRCEKKNTLALKKENLEFKRSMIQNTPISKRKNPTLIFIGMALIIVGIVAFGFNKVVGGIIMGIGLIAFVAGWILYAVIKPVESAKGYDFTPEETEIAQIEEFVIKSEQDVKAFMSEFGLEYEEYSVITVLNDLKKGVDKYTYLLEKESENELLINDTDIINSRRELDDFISKYYNIRYKVSDLPRYIYELESKVDYYMDSKAEYEQALNSVNEFKNSPYFSHISKNMTTKDTAYLTDSLEEHDNKLNQIASDMENLHKNILDYSVNLNKLQEEYDVLSEKIEVLGTLQTKYDEEYKKYSLIEKTRELLTTAKVSFTCKYTDGITKGFKKYYSMLADETADNYIIDANGNITVEEKGFQRDKRYLSAGNRDLVGICMRMALVDAMYNDEKPFVIFDDPFVNLDNDRLMRGLKFISDISKEYQVIYFTCHDSRGKV